MSFWTRRAVSGALDFFAAGRVFLLCVYQQSTTTRDAFSRYVLLMAGLFSLFRYSLDLRRYGTAMLGPDNRRDATF
jgi:hypothetical protein